MRGALDRFRPGLRRRKRDQGGYPPRGSGSEPGGDGGWDVERAAAAGLAARDGGAGGSGGRYAPGGYRASGGMFRR